MVFFLFIKMHVHTPIQDCKAQTVFDSYQRHQANEDQGTPQNRSESYFRSRYTPTGERVNAVLSVRVCCLYLGNITDVMLKEDNYLAKVLLTASRKAITRKCLDMDPHRHSQWLDKVQEILMMEKITYSLRVKEAVFNRKWGKCIRFKHEDFNMKNV